MTYEPSEKDLELSRRFLSGGMTDEEYEEAMERVQNQVDPATIKAPESTDRANKAAAWLRDPALMLVDLTETLNELLKYCEYRNWDCGDGPDWKLEVIPEHFKKHNLLDFMIHLRFQQDAALLRIRHGIEPTPFSSDVIQTVEQTFETFAHQFRNNERVSLDSIDRFTFAVFQYETELQILADWIETRAIFRGEKRTPKKTDKTATDDDIMTAMRTVENRGQPINKTTVGECLRTEMGKSIGTDFLFSTLRKRKNASRHSPQ